MLVNADEGHYTIERLEHRYAYAPDVSFVVVRPAVEDLGRHVQRCAALLDELLALGQSDTETKVGELDLS